MSEFTPGPWTVYERGVHVRGMRMEMRFHIGNDRVSHTVGECDGIEDANLIAAAPEMYEACDECLHALRALIVHGQLSDDSIDYLEKKLNAALNKADGNQKARGE